VRSLVDNPAACPDPFDGREMPRATIVRANLVTPRKSLGAVITALCEKRGVQHDMLFLVRRFRLSMTADEMKWCSVLL